MKQLSHHVIKHILLFVDDEKITRCRRINRTFNNIIGGDIRYKYYFI